MENRIAKEFRDHLKEFDLETLETSPDVIYAIDRNLNFTYYNPSWIEFAEKNKGPEDILDLHPIGSSLFKGMSGESVDFYQSHYSSAFEKEHPTIHEYECSSPEHYRIYAQFSYPVANRNNVLIINRLVYEEPISAKNKKKLLLPDEKKFRDRYGYLTQCSNCRCFKPANEDNRWEWVSVWSEAIPEKTSHSVCPTCYDFHWKNSK